MIINLVGLVVILSLVVVYQYLQNRSLLERNFDLRCERVRWAKRSLESERKLKVTQEICNVTMRNALEYKRELGRLKSGTIEIEVESIDQGTIRVFADRIASRSSEASTEVDLGVVGGRIVDGTLKSKTVSSNPRKGAVL